MDENTQKAVQALLKNSESGETKLEQIFGDRNAVAAMAMCWEQAAELIHVAEIHMMLSYVNGSEDLGFSGKFNSDQSEAFILGVKALSTLMIACYKENMENVSAESPQESNDED